MSAQTARLAATPSPWGSPSGPGLWGHKGWKLPNYVEQVSKGIMKSGRAATESEAIHMALGVLARWARGGGKVSPEVQAAAAKAIAEFQALRAKSHAHANPGREAITLARVAPGGGSTTSSKTPPGVAGMPSGAQVNAATGATGPRAKASSGKSSAGGGGGSGFDAKHPRIGAGNTGGGRFAKKGSGTSSSSSTAAAKKPATAKAPAKKAAAGKAAPPKMNATPAKPGSAKGKTPAKGKPKPPAGSRAAKLAQKTQLQTQAKNDRAKARAIFTQIAQLTAAIHTAVKAAAASTASTTATKTAATAATAAAAATTAAAKTAATAATTTATTTASTTAKTTSSVPAMRAKRAGLRVQAHTLVVRANSLDKQAAAIHLSTAGGAAALELAGVPFREELARRIPPGKPGGGRFTEPGDELTRYATPDQTAVAVNRLAPDQRAVCRATVMPPPGYEWAAADRLIPAT